MRRMTRIIAAERAPVATAAQARRWGLNIPDRINGNLPLVVQVGGGGQVSPAGVGGDGGNSFPRRPTHHARKADIIHTTADEQAETMSRIPNATCDKNPVLMTDPATIQASVTPTVTMPQRK